jgi:hypothetical protein
MIRVNFIGARSRVPNTALGWSSVPKQMPSRGSTAVASASGVVASSAPMTISQVGWLIVAVRSIWASPSTYFSIAAFAAATQRSLNDAGRGSASGPC